MSLHYIKSGQGNIHVVLDGNSRIVAVGHRNYDKIAEALDIGDVEVLRSPDLFNVTSAIQDFVGVDMEVRAGELFFRGKAYCNTLGDEILKQLAAGYAPGPMLRFLEKCENNPDPASVRQLFGWMKHVGLAMSDDGDVLGFKYVIKTSTDSELYKRGVFHTDGWTQKLNYNPGETPEMPRYKVEHDPAKGCAPGLHVGTLSFVKGHGTIILVKVNPADVVSVPTDCRAQKLRCCRFYSMELIDLESGSFSENGFSEPVMGTDGTQLTPSEFKRTACFNYKTVEPEPEDCGELDNPKADHWNND